jgi:glycine/D-amino acid oxidase-like deaminating enzyme
MRRANTRENPGKGGRADMETSWDDKIGSTYPKLKKDIETEVVVVGGGLAGIITLYLLSSSGVKAVLLEADIIGNHATMRTTALITQVVDTNLRKLRSMFGEDGARMVWRSGVEAISLIENIITRENIDCDFQRCPGYVYASNKEQAENIILEYGLASKFAFEVHLRTHHGLNFKNYGYMEVPDQAKFHPVKFLRALAKISTDKGAQIFEQSKAERIGRKRFVKAETVGGSVKALKGIIATYQPFQNPLRVFAKKGMYTSYVLEAQIKRGRFREGIYWDYYNPYYYFRIDKLGEKDRMILGGADHRSEIPMDREKKTLNIT